MPSLNDLVVERIRRFGSLRFDEVIETALYDPDHGFYATGGQAGRHGDFLTSPEVGPLFGAVLARALDIWWTELGRPDPFVVVEAGAGRGVLARSILDANPACSLALRYVTVERSTALRERQRELLPLADPASTFGPRGLHDDLDDDDDPPALTGTGPVVVALAELPALPVEGVVLANELLDNLPSRLLERTADGWGEVRVSASSDGSLTELVVPASEEVASLADRFAPLAAPGARIPLQEGAADWLRDATGVLQRGRIVLFDYASTSAEMAARPVDEWLRTYREHTRGGPSLAELGQQDVTVEVATDQLDRVLPGGEHRSQADFLVAHGIDELVAEGRRIWAERAHLGDLEAVRARSRVTEAEALLDPAGLGAFRVSEWTIA